MDEIEQLRALVVLLKKEVECLRSVLSEYDGDKNCYVQMVRANIFREAIETFGVSK